MSNNYDLAFDYDGIPPRVAEELERIAGTFQAWTIRGNGNFTKELTAVQPRCRYVLTDDQAITTATDTDIVWTGVGQHYTPSTVFDAAQFDNGATFGGAFLRTTSGADLYLPIPGVYLVIATIFWEGVNDGRRFVKISPTMATAAVGLYQQASGLVIAPEVAASQVSFVTVVVSHTSATDPLDVQEAAVDIVKLS
jgi:hypothetical protein